MPSNTNGAIKIRFSPRIAVDELSVESADFVVSGSTVTDVLLAKYKVVLALATPITASNIDDIKASYAPQDNRKIAIGNTLYC